MSTSITCPVCGAVSYSAMDIEARYCGRCHQFHDAMLLQVPNTAPAVTEVWMWVSRDREGRENVLGSLMGALGTPWGRSR